MLRSGVGLARPLCALVLGLMSWLGLGLRWDAGRLNLSVTEARADTVGYAYDASGRLIQATDATSGYAVMYEYDSSGNIKSRQVVAVGTLAVSGTSVDQGASGTQFTIYGTGFSATPGDDTVKIGGVTATVVSATQTELVVTVPAGSAAGVVSVSVGSSTASSNTSFTTSGASAAPTISGFSPGTGAAGTAVTISGTGFQTTATDDTVLLNETWATVSSATSTSLHITVPAQAGSGKLSVTTQFGRVVSATDFIIPPAGYTTSSIGWTGRTTIGSSATVSLSSAGHIGLLLFDGTRGALLAVGVSADTIASCTIKVFTPDGELLTTSAAITANGQGVQIPPLPSDGTYAVVVDPGTDTGSVTVQLAAPVPGTITAGGAPLALTLAPPGERALVTFSGTGGQYRTLGFTNDSVPSATVTVYQPNAAQLVDGTVTTSTTGLQLPKLPATGTYTVMVDPGSNSGKISVALITPISTSMTVGGSPLNLSLTPTGQRAYITFSGTAGQYLTLTPSPGLFPTATVSVTTPAGATLSSQSVALGATAVQLPGLPATGTYTIFIDIGNNSAGLSLSLLNAVTGTDQTYPAILDLSTPVQRGVITFTGTPGKYATLTIQQGYEYQPNYISGISVVVYAPDGSNLNTSSVMGPPPGGPTTSFTCENGPCFGASIINLGPLPTYSQGTTYTAVIQQTGGSGGYLYYSVNTPIQSSQSLTVNGGAIEAYFALPGGGMMIPVSLNAGQQYTLTISETNGNIQQVDALLLNSQGQGVQGAGMSATCTLSTCTVQADDQYSGSESDGIGVSVTGNYTLLIQQVTQTNGTNYYPPLIGDLSVQITSP